MNKFMYVYGYELTDEAKAKHLKQLYFFSLYIYVHIYYICYICYIYYVYMCVCVCSFKY